MSNVLLSQNTLKNINKTRKRKFMPEGWKDHQAKEKRSSGEPYVPRSKIPKPGKIGPTIMKVCRQQCELPGCNLNLAAKRRLFTEFYAKSTNYGKQRTYLMGYMDKYGELQRQRYRYYLPNQGERLQTCRVTFMDTYQITKNMVENCRKRLEGNQNVANDMRGKHLNRPKRQLQEVDDEIIEHINGFPKYQSHYSRRENEFYLSSDLNLKRMFTLFVETHPHIVDVEKKYWSYRANFLKLKLKFGLPHSDTCSTCDKLHIKLLAANTQIMRTEVESTIEKHHKTADNGYKDMYNDIQLSKNDANLVVLCGDLQQVLFSPTLTHSHMFYKRQFSTYNYCIYNGGLDTGYMGVWHENEGKRGVDEVSSVIMKYITENFEILQENDTRSLIFWSDRCRGQINNWFIIILFQILIQKKYFTTVEQKFLISGHTFLPCDRLFALIEKKKSKKVVINPEEWTEVIRETQTQNPFQIIRMNQGDITDIKKIEKILPRPITLKITEVAKIFLSKDNPHVILTRGDHNTSVWDYHLIHSPGRNMIVNRPHWTNDCFIDFHLERKYFEPLPISLEKYQDLMSMLDYILPDLRDFFRNLTYKRKEGNVRTRNRVAPSTERVSDLVQEQIDEEEEVNRVLQEL